ncbi:hypothetical protein [Rhodococcus opacus]|jgi:hypothetical protein|uniref:hypothetical protein n=1 Tax=Rhodococcus opacus TaxID=37919 RepID=UPI0010572955|nr:hypothetical protein [Rhodococcus opacus]
MASRSATLSGNMINHEPPQTAWLRQASELKVDHGSSCRPGESGDIVDEAPTQRGSPSGGTVAVGEGSDGTRQLRDHPAGHSVTVRAETTDENIPE